MISGKYSFAKNPKTSGIDMVSPRVIATIEKTLAHFAKIICDSESGRVKRTSIVFVLFSSLILLIDKAGIRIKSNHGATEKNDFIEADPITNTSLVNKYPRKSANTIGTVNPTGEFKSCMISFLYSAFIIFLLIF